MKFADQNLAKKNSAVLVQLGSEIEKDFKGIIQKGTRKQKQDLADRFLTILHNNPWERLKNQAKALLILKGLKR